MSWCVRAAIGVLALGLGAALLGRPWPASAEGTVPEPGSSSETEAIVLAHRRAARDHSNATRRPAPGEQRESVTRSS